MLFLLYRFKNFINIFEKINDLYIHLNIVSGKYEFKDFYLMYPI